MSSVCSEDVFGIIRARGVEGKLSHLKKMYVEIADIVNPEKYIDNLDDKEMAEDALKRLDEFYERAQEKIKSKTYGQRQDDHVNDFTIKTEKRIYYLDSILTEGDISTVYNGGCLGGDDFAGQIIAKIVDDPEDNDLMQNEIRILKRLQSEPSAQSKHLSILLDKFRTKQGQTGVILRRNGLSPNSKGYNRQVDGYNLFEVRKKYKDGVPQKHVVWMMNRFLSAIGLAHKRGIVHCNIDPGNIMIRPRDHNLWVIDWSYGVVSPGKTREEFKVLNPDFSAPEVEMKGSPTPACDLYSFGKCVIFLLGGDIKTESMPSKVDQRLQRFVKYFVKESPNQRPRDAWFMHGELIRLIEGMWGPRKFLEFRM